MWPVQSEWRGVGALDLLERVHREGTGAVEPALVARAGVQREEGAAVAGGAVTEPGALAERAGVPHELARCLEQAVGGVVAGEGGQARDEAGRTVAPLHADREVCSAQYGSAAVGQLTRPPSWSASVVAVSAAAR